MMLEPEKLQNRGKQGWPDAGKGTAEHLRREAVTPEARQERLQHHRAAESLRREAETPEVRQERLQHHRAAEHLRREAETPEARQQRLQHKHIYVQVPACTQGVLTVPPTLCYGKRSTNNVSCSLLRLAPQCPHSLVEKRESILLHYGTVLQPFPGFMTFGVICTYLRYHSLLFVGMLASLMISTPPLQ